MPDQTGFYIPCLINTKFELRYLKNVKTKSIYFLRSELKYTKNTSKHIQKV